MARDRARFGSDVIGFYGASEPHLFEIERRCMDPDGLLIRFLDSRLPGGRILDVGAGDGFTAERLSNPGRTIVALEPDPGMVSSERWLIWVSGVAQDLPFHDDTLDGAYSTWAFFLSGTEPAALDKGLSEVARVVRPGGPMIFADNAGGDEFCGLSDRPIHGDPSRWTERGFEAHVLRSSFRFDTLEEALELLTFYFGEAVVKQVKSTEIGFNIAAYVGRSGEVTT